MATLNWIRSDGICRSFGPFRIFALFAVILTATFESYADYADEISEGLPIKASHIVNLRAAAITKADECGVAHSLVVNPLNQVSEGEFIRAVHLQDIQALTKTVYDAYGQTAPIGATSQNYFQAGQLIRASELRSLKAAIDGIDFCSGPVDGVCGASSTGAFPYASNIVNPCATGSASAITNPVGGAFPWTSPLCQWQWTCSGVQGGATVNCSADCALPTDNECGLSHQGYFTTDAPPSSNFCDVGQASELTTQPDGSWAWSCSSATGPAVNCWAIRDGKCGSANGSAFPASSPPSTNLCMPAEASLVTWVGTEWHWVCSPSAGGGSANCSAQLSSSCADNAACDDGNPCTVDTCIGGACNNPAGNAGSVCRAAAGVCDIAETCDGSEFCPPDAKYFAGIACPSDGNSCTTDVCDGSSDACQHDNNTEACDDGNACTENDVCSSGVCAGVNGPVNGGWSPWDVCDASGQQTRTCTNPAPSCGGVNCVGASSQNCEADGTTYSWQYLNDSYISSFGGTAPLNFSSSCGGDCSTFGSQCYVYISDWPDPMSGAHWWEYELYTCA